jgi:hypothetical protein
MRAPWRRAASATAKHGDAEAALPEPPHEVMVTLADGERLPARFTEGEELLILVMVPVRQSFSAEQLREVVVEVVAKQGLIQLAGSATLEASDLLRFTIEYSLGIQQRREYVRVRTSRPVLVRSSGGMAPVESASLDLSGGGMLLGGLEHLRVGARIDFRLVTDPAGPPIAGSGRVVRSEADGRRAIAFDSISEGDRRRLIRFLFDCQREERRRGLRQEDENGY